MSIKIILFLKIYNYINIKKYVTKNGNTALTKIFSLISRFIFHKLDFSVFSGTELLGDDFNPAARIPNIATCSSLSYKDLNPIASKTPNLVGS